MVGFMLVSTLYPLPYLISLIATIINLSKKQFRTALVWQLGLVGYLIIVGLFFTAWLHLGEP